MKYDLEDRTLRFALEVRSFVKLLPRTVADLEDVRQLVRASGSVGANYLEANEALGRKDLAMRLRIARKEAKESGYWLQLVDLAADEALARRQAALVREATELMNILGAILKKVV